MGRVARTNIPTSPKLVYPKTVTDVHDQLRNCQEKQKFFYDKQAEKLSALNENDTVRIERNKKWIPAKVTAKAMAPRSFVVTTSNGQAYLQNRQYIIKTSEEKTSEDPPDITGPIPDLPNEVGPKVNIVMLTFKQFNYKHLIH